MSEGTLIILAGGESRRMGREKALVEIVGETLIERTARLIAPLFKRLIVVANKDLGVSIAGAEFVSDLVPRQGPIGGIHTGLTLSETEDNFVVACDMPFLSAEVVHRIRILRGGADVALPRTYKGLEPLCASYSKRCLGAIEDTMSAGKRRIIAFFDKVEVRVIEARELSDLREADRSFINVNSEPELESALELFGGSLAKDAGNH